MFDTATRSRRGEPLSSAELDGLVALLARLDTTAGDTELVDRIRALEQVKAAAAAAQARVTAAFAASQRRAQGAAGVKADRIGQGIATQVALARRDSPTRTGRYVGWATVLVGELPCTFAALERGETSEWRAMLIARETIWLSRADRAAVDTELADRLPSLGDFQVECEVRKIAYRLDPDGFVARSRAAASSRRVSLRPAPDTMSRLTALLPVAQGVAAYAALFRAADAARAAGDSRGRGQVMADTLVERVTGQSAADEVPVHIDLVMTDETLFGDAAHTGRDSATGPCDASGPSSTATPSNPKKRSHSAETSNATEPDSATGSAGAAVPGEETNRGVHVGSQCADERPGSHCQTQSDVASRDPEGDAFVPRGSDELDAVDEQTSDGFGDGVELDDQTHDDFSGGSGRNEEPRDPGSRDDNDYGRNEPAHLVGYGPIPAGLARDLVRTTNAQVWIRRLFRRPTTRQLVAMESRARFFPEGIRTAIVLRDQICRTPWCGAPIRHSDHARNVARGGDTSFSNGQGLCEACNYAKEAPGWQAAPGSGGTEESVMITTPTGHTYTSRPPDLPGTGRHRPAPTVLAGPPSKSARPNPPIADDQAA